MRQRPGCVHSAGGGGVSVFAVSTTPLEQMNPAEELANAAAGALVVFEGRVRDHSDGKKVVSLEYQAYEELACSEGTEIIKEAQTRFDILDAKCVHRVGQLDVGELAVWIGVVAAHRAEAFRACEYIIDQIKLRVPIWKKEFFADGDGEWVNRPASSGVDP